MGEMQYISRQIGESSHKMQTVTVTSKTNQ